MKSFTRIATGGALIFFAALSANAQMGMRPPQFGGVFNPVIGAGAEYEIQTKGDKMVMQLVIVGKESVGGKDAYWFEYTMQSPRTGGEIIMKHLMVIDGQNTSVSRMIMQLPGRPPMEFSTQMMQMNGKTSQPTDIRTLAEDVGSESVTVPAGTFNCEHYRMKDGSGDTWVAQKVYPWGLVKHQGKDTTMVLTKVITDAKDKITGTPVPFNPMNMAQPPGQPQQ